MIDANVGTLLWIGPRDGDEFEPPHRFCECVASQIAWRPNVDEALRRPASDVRGIVLAQSDRAAVSDAALDFLAERYPDAARLNLLGSLCEGLCRYPVGFFGGDRHYWHRWNQILPEFVRSCGVVQEPVDRAASVLILASRFTDAETLLDLVASTGATAFWSRSADTVRVRNVDAVWWDDSVAPPATASDWVSRTSFFASHTTRHAWIANGVRSDQVKSAMAGGVDIVVSKPYRVELLVDMLRGNAKHASNAEKRCAA